MHLGRHELGLETAGVGREWLLTNGRGGFASSTVSGLNTRRYHGWLVAQVARYGGRFVVLSKCEEELRVDGKTYRLTTNRTLPGPTVEPRGYRYLQGFDLAPLPIFTYYLGGFFIERTMFMVQGENRVVVSYRFDSPRAARLSLRLRPLVTFRFYHHLLSANDWPFTTQARPEQGWITVQPYHDSPVLVLRPTGAQWSPGGMWRHAFDYLEEHQRGLDHVEDLYSPGFFEFSDLRAGDRVALTAALAEDAGMVEQLRSAPFSVDRAEAWRAAEESRLVALVGRARTTVEGVGRTLGRAVSFATSAAAPLPEERDVRPPELGEPSSPEAAAFFARLVRATDAYVAVRGTADSQTADSQTTDSQTTDRRTADRRTTVIAGYPWFEDWGRDTFIALPGLLLVTGRHREAFQVLTDYASYVRDGLIPNRFPDQAEDPDYNTADAALWFVAAVQAYLGWTGDRESVVDRLLEPVLDILSHYQRGTGFGIGAGPEGLLHAGAPGFAVTWMDAKLGDWVVTPRHGYPVELNALWYNALRFAAELDRPEGRHRWRELAARVRSAFNTRYWNAEQGCLYDVVHELDQGAPPDAAIRPNQLLAVSLPFAVLDPTRWRPVVEVCLKELYVIYGLRTLSRGDPAYRGLYRGGPAERDGAYHQGTVWPWLLGPFITALRRSQGRSPESRVAAARMLRPFERHLREAGIGHIAEVFDGDFPFLPGGCVAQAWSVAEVLRAYVEDVLEVRPRLGGAATPD